jgi:uncharacterized membrane protein
MINSMFLSVASISSPGWLLPAGAVVALGLILLWWGYRSTLVRPGEKLLFAFIKLLGVLALATCLIEPLWTGQRVKPGANVFVVMADNSQGMTIKDAGAALSRSEILAGLLQPDRKKWQQTLDEFFQMRRYQFDARLQATKDFSELRFDGRSSNLGSALRTVADRFKGQPVAGVLVFTDGNATDIAGPFDAAGLPPIFPVVVGGNGPSHDIALGEVAVTQTAFEDAPVTVQAEVTSSGFDGEVVAQLLDVTSPAAGEEKVVGEQRQRVAANRKSNFRFQVRPERSGISFYRVRAFARGTFEQFKNPKTTGEATLANNVRVVPVDRSGGPYRILYVSGRPNWEFKFLRRALEEDKELELVGLIRIAKREPKFEFRGRTGEASNPLFRGFDKKDEETERYDQPVLVRLNTRDDTELRGGFPKTSEELFAYHAVIVDDLEAQFFTPDQLALLQKFVSERGGGFLMLGGQESFQQGKYQRTPVAELLPVYLDQVIEDAPVGGLRLNITREGWLQPWARLRATEAEERQRLADVPEFEVVNRLRSVKPGATVVATLGEGQAQYPALVVQRYGRGRSAAITIGDLWRSGLQSEEMQGDLGKQWRQTIRWLVADVPGRIEVEAITRTEESGSATDLEVRARDRQFQPLNNAQVSVTVLPAGGARGADGTNATRLSAEPSTTEAGTYETTYIARDSGAFLAEAVVTDEAGAEIGRASAAWSSDPAAQEFHSLKPNRSLLEQLARTTGGRVIEAADLEKFAKDLPHQKVPVMETWSSPIWHRGSVFVFALLCFAAEWGLRRWRGLA